MYRNPSLISIFITAYSLQLTAYSLQFIAYCKKQLFNFKKAKIKEDFRGFTLLLLPRKSKRVV